MTTENTPQLEKLLGRAQLPALPQSAIRLLELSQDPDNGPAEFAVPIESDPGLTGQVLRFVNSSYFGFANEISSIKLAISMVGIRTIKNFAMWSAVFSLMPNPKSGTVTADVAKAVTEVKAGKINFKVDKTGIINASIGKASFDAKKISENAMEVVLTISRLKPASAKGTYFKSISMSSTMSPGIAIDKNSIEGI